MTAKGSLLLNFSTFGTSLALFTFTERDISPRAQYHYPPMSEDGMATNTSSNVLIKCVGAHHEYRKETHMNMSNNKNHLCNYTSGVCFSCFNVPGANWI